MKIAIVSDTHDNVPNFKKAVDWIKKQKISIIIHCGDIFKPETVKEILKSFKGKIYIVFSPADADFSGIPADSFKRLKRVKVFEEFGEIKISGKKIAFCHFPEIANDLAASQDYDLVFYGHSHKPWLQTFRWCNETHHRHDSGQETKLVNPGNLAGIFYKPTFAIYDTKDDKLELKILEKL